jgi:hypothetical protein
MEPVWQFDTVNGAERIVRLFVGSEMKAIVHISPSSFVANVYDETNAGQEVFTKLAEAQDWVFTKLNASGTHTTVHEFDIDAVPPVDENIPQVPKPRKAKVSTPSEG